VSESRRKDGRLDYGIERDYALAVGDCVVFVLGDRLGQRSLSNLVYIHQVGSL